jgi:hypothetical protein
MSLAKCPHILSCKPPISLKKHKQFFFKRVGGRRFSPFTILVRFGQGGGGMGRDEADNGVA